MVHGRTEVSEGNPCCPLPPSVVGGPARGLGVGLRRPGRLGRLLGLVPFALSLPVAWQRDQGGERARGEGGHIAQVTSAVEVPRLLQTCAVGAVLCPW